MQQQSPLNRGEKQLGLFGTPRKSHPPTQMYRMLFIMESEPLQRTSELIPLRFWSHENIIAVNEPAGVLSNWQGQRLEKESL